jgi:hypothetical protein
MGRRGVSMITNHAEAMALFEKTVGNAKKIGDAENATSYLVGDEVWWLQFKREFYRNFGAHFEHLGLRGYGEILSYSTLKSAVNEGVVNMVVILPDGKIYRYSPAIALEFVDKHNTHVPHLKGEVAFPIDMLERVNPDKLKTSKTSKTQKTLEGF